jgi:carboxymethylenebutenolidase
LQCCEEFGNAMPERDGMQNHWIELDVAGETMPAYVAEPDGAPRSAVLVLQEIFGVNENIRAATDLVAGAGYLAIAPALFHRTDPHFDASYDEAGFAKGRAAAGSLDLPQLVADLTAASEYARSRLGTDVKIGTWGFCFGGSIAFLSATLPFVAAAVSFYGGQIATSPAPTRPALLVMAPQLTAPVFFAFGGKDIHIPQSEVGKIEDEMKKLNKPYELHVYADEDHGFFRFGPNANDGARDVWPRVQAFLKANLS